MRLIRLLTLAGLIAAIAVVIRALLESDDPAPVAVAPTPPAPKPADGPKAGPAESTAPSNGGGSEPSREQLYKRAQELNVKGRSKMSKAELARAVAEAERG